MPSAAPIISSSRRPRTNKLRRWLQVSRRFARLIKDSALLRYHIELAHAALRQLYEPISMRISERATIQHLESLRKQQFGWRNLTWRARHVIPLDFPNGALYELSSGILITGKRRKAGVARSHELLIRELPSLVTVADPIKRELECQVGLSQICVDTEQDLLVLLEEDSQRVTKNDTLTLRIHLKSVSTGTVHPRAVKQILEYRCTSQWSTYSFVIQVMGHSLGVLFTSGIVGNSEYERFVIWDWTTGLQRAMVSRPSSRYDSFTFIAADTFVIPCAQTQTINVFLFRPTPPTELADRGPAIHHLCALKLPGLDPRAGYKYTSVTCQSQPTPPAQVFHSSEAAFQRPKKLFIPDSENGIILFTAHVSQGSRSTDMQIIAHRNALMSFIAPSQEKLGDPLPEPWESYPTMPTAPWGPNIAFAEWRAIARCLISPLMNSINTKWRYQVFGHRLVQLVHTTTPREGKIRVLDFNPLFVQRPPLFPEDYHPVVQGTVTRKIVTEVGTIPKGEIWSEDILSSLPYYEVTTKEMFPLAGVMVDDERIIGLRTGSPGNPDIVALDVFVI
ncbi:hypothetical protein CPB86DRAFT_872718 [Serendipita vermifera]|nr:hypothetical protein CPB86DRAFT_872718 [Serendipita vermifera]